MKDPIDAVQTLERLKATGKLRHYALSNFGPLDIGTFVASNGKPVLNQVSHLVIYHALCLNSLGLAASIQFAVESN